MIYIFSFLVMVLSVLSCEAKLPACGSSDTTIVENDTTVQKLLCHENKQKRRLLLYKNGLMHGKAFSWYENGKKGGIVFYKKNKYHGSRNGWHKNGQRGLEAEYKDGKPIGIHKRWFSNGRYKAIKIYNKDGKKHGLSETWREDGTRKDSVVYDNGEIVELREYFATGVMRHWIKLKDKKRYEADFFHPDGTRSGTIKKGNGKIVSYTEDGESAYAEVYVNGRETESREINKGGKLKILNKNK